ncbi:MAG TPA: N-6 DNA methylase [Verrucomicrobiota bacterium]|nr:N-6 DNA methylase [Verrucomicrobiota bacterium]HQB15843.1 N-6 DNA methylase [Verrucomicrobiota bacterium]
MLDAPTKARIDSARDILVGKVPDPKSQVEQITIALIYKFMDDMDRQSEELGGKASFFTGNFRKYRWTNLLDKRLGSHERLALYAEGIERMNQNQNIPQLFRDIFKGVFLPYRDPETLNLFLKEINGFTYEHSERLGDAYEYLLSVLGTQGDAGQFRTPRHIIDFIVTVMDPQKHETLLDPACGTAGFLISAYKHILAENCPNSPPRPPRPTVPLTPDERARLMTNFCGYDIAPDMVRLSRVNLYLHGFPNPVIHEYDTLTSEERWDERYDVIMANPPFMTPKGGIRPHQRFSIKAKRSEVLFVDYIAEHLNPGGRAGIIVPEGIIFQSQNAYKNLRKMLVENYLWAAVSLPAGVFNPYSGVKTSILFLDRALARRAADVLFVKIENDGFDLGAQRRPIEKNDLPAALRALQEWKSAPRPTRSTDQTGSAHAVPRKRLLAAPDISLSGDRYRAVEVRPGKWPMVRIESVCQINPPKSELKGDFDVSFVPMSQLREHQPSFDTVETKPGSEVIKGYTYFRNDDVLLAKITPCFENGKAGIARGLRNGIGFGSTEFIVLRADTQRLLPELLYYFISSKKFRERGVKNMTGTAGQQRLALSFVRNYEIPLPPLAEQERLVAELEGYRQIIEAARQILTHYKPTLRIDPKWPMVKLGDCANLVASGITPLGGKKTYVSEGVLFIRSQNILVGECDFSDAAFITHETHKEMSRSQVKCGDVLLNITGASIGRCAVFRKKAEANVNQHVCIIRLQHGKVEPEYLSFLINQPSFQDYIMRIQSGASRQALNYQQIRAFDVPLPPLSIQREIVAELEAERALVEANRELIARMEQKLAAKLAEIWGAPSAVSDASAKSEPSDSTP